VPSRRYDLGLSGASTLMRIVHHIPVESMMDSIYDLGGVGGNIAAVQTDIAVGVITVGKQTAAVEQFASAWVEDTMVSSRLMSRLSVEF